MSVELQLSELSELYTRLIVQASQPQPIEYQMDNKQLAGSSLTPNNSPEDLQDIFGGSKTK